MTDNTPSSEDMGIDQKEAEKFGRRELFRRAAETGVKILAAGVASGAALQALTPPSEASGVDNKRPEKPQSWEVGKYPFPICEHPASFNQFGVEGGEKNDPLVITVESVKTAFAEMEEQVKNNESVLEQNALYAQLTLPVTDIRVRNPDSHLGRYRQGLGFTPAKLADLWTKPEFFDPKKHPWTLGDDGRWRAIGIGPAKEAPEVGLAAVDGSMMISGKDPFDGQFEEERKKIFERMMYGDFGIKPRTPTGDWKDIGDDYEASETTLGNVSAADGKQHEQLNATRFSPENRESGLPQTMEMQSDKTMFIMVFVYDPKEDFLRGEFLVINHKPDSLNENFDNDARKLRLNPDLSGDGGRLLALSPDQAARKEAGLPIVVEGQPPEKQTNTGESEEEFKKRKEKKEKIHNDQGLGTGPEGIPGPGRSSEKQGDKDESATEKEKKDKGKGPK